MNMRTDLYQGHDYYNMDELLTEEHKLIRDTARAWVKQEVSPIIEDAAERCEFPKHLLPGLGDWGLGPYILRSMEGPRPDRLRLIMQELERCDRAWFDASVQSHGHVPDLKYGTEEQKQKFLPKLATGEWMGCWPDRARPRVQPRGHGDQLQGRRRRHHPQWSQDVDLQRPLRTGCCGVGENEEGRIHGVIVERGMEGFSTPTMKGKWSLRASDTGELIFDNVRVPKSNILPGRSGLGAPLSCLDSARYGIAWGAIGAALDCYDVGLRYAKERTQFGRPIAGFQLQQKKLAEAITEITKAQLLTHRLGVLRNEGRATSAQISMAKRNNVDMAIHIAREMRQILGGMGIMNEYPIMRHMANLESVITYEGTHDIHLLITGLDITGENAFK